MPGNLVFTDNLPKSGVPASDLFNKVGETLGILDPDDRSVFKDDIGKPLAVEEESEIHIFSKGAHGKLQFVENVTAVDGGTAGDNNNAFQIRLGAFVNKMGNVIFPLTVPGYPVGSQAFDPADDADDFFKRISGEMGQGIGEEIRVGVGIGINKEDKIIFLGQSKPDKGGV